MDTLQTGRADPAPARLGGHSRHLLRLGRAKFVRKGTDLLVVHEVGWDLGFEVLENTVVILGAGGAVVETAAGGKRLIADDERSGPDRGDGGGDGAGAGHACVSRADSPGEGPRLLAGFAAADGGDHE